MKWRDEDTEEALKAACQAERDPAIRTRLHGLLAVAQRLDLSDGGRGIGRALPVGPALGGLVSSGRPGRGAGAPSHRDEVVLGPGLRLIGLSP